MAKAKKENKVVSEVKKEQNVSGGLKFSKKQFVNSQRFIKRKDLVNALLKEGEMYSIKEVEDLINDFLYGNKK